MARSISETVERSSSLLHFKESAAYPPYLRRGNAAESCRFHAMRFCKGRGVDVGASRWPFPGARAIENLPEENAYLIREAAEALDFVFSSHCLEHLDRWEAALDEWARVIRKGGVMYLYLPHPACRMWAPEALEFHRWAPDPITVTNALEARGFEILSSSDFPDVFFSFHVAARKRLAH